MELESIFAKPELRRCWLLSKALESASLDKALRLALAVEDFLGAGRPSAPARKSEHALAEQVLDVPPMLQSVAGFPMTSPRSARADEPCTLPPVEVGASAPSAMDLIVELVESFENAGAGEHHAADEGAAEEDDAEDEPAVSAPQTSMASDLAVLANMDDVVRYLRQQDDVVVSAGAGVYLVNGRFHLTSEELFVRANKIRHRHGKPQFQRIPTGFPLTNGAASVECMQDRT